MVFAFLYPVKYPLASFLRITQSVMTYYSLKIQAQTIDLRHQTPVNKLADYLDVLC
jgi:hypothetical protein